MAKREGSDASNSISIGPASTFSCFEGDDKPDLVSFKREVISFTGEDCLPMLDDGSGVGYSSNS